MEQTVTTTTTKGLVLGLLLVVLGIVIYFSGIDVNGPVKWISLVVFILGIVWSVYSYGKELNYNSTFGNYFAHGFKVTALVTVIMIIYIILLVLLFPEFKEKGIEQGRKAMQEQNKLTKEQIDSYMTGMSKFFMVIVVATTLFMYIIMGALASLVGAAITKKEPNPIKNVPNQPLQ